MNNSVLIIYLKKEGESIMDFSPSDKVLELMQSEIRNMSIECDRTSGINLSQGICDLPLPEILKNGIQEAVKLGYNCYTRYDGIPYLREQIAKKASGYNHIQCDPEKNIVVSCGATGALYCACYAMFNVGDEVILFEPFYGYHAYTLTSLHLRPVYVKLKQNNWEIDFFSLESAITSHTKAIIISNPANPCGKVFSSEELKKIGELCEKYNLFLLSDEIYEYITFDGKEHVSPASLPGLKERTVTVSGYSKTYSITGWRIGYSIADEKITEMIGGVNDLLYVCAPAPLQYAVAAAIEKLPVEYYLEICDGYRKKRDLLCEVLSKCQLQPSVPEGAYYVLADVSVIPGKNSREKAMYLLNETGVGAVPGEAFYSDGFGTNILRFCFAKDISAIQKAGKLIMQNSNKWC